MKTMTFVRLLASAVAAATVFWAATAHATHDPRFRHGAQCIDQATGRLTLPCNDDSTDPLPFTREQAQAWSDGVKAKRAAAAAAAAAANNCGTRQVRVGALCQELNSLPTAADSSQGSYYERPWTSFFTGATKTVGWTSANKNSYFQDGDIEVEVGTDGRIFFTAYPSNSYGQRGVIAQAIALTPVGRASTSASISVTTCTNYSVTAKPIFTNDQLLYGNAPSAWQLVATKQPSRNCYEPEGAPPFQ